jgi:hypothetical protein
MNVWEKGGWGEEEESCILLLRDCTLVIRHTIVSLIEQFVLYLFSIHLPCKNIFTLEYPSAKRA